MDIYANIAKIGQFSASQAFPQIHTRSQYNAVLCQNREKVVKQWEAAAAAVSNLSPFHMPLFSEVGRPAMHYPAAAAAADLVSCCAIMI